MIINHNLTSLSALNITSATDAMLQKSIQPLASGLRVKTAADDASGLAISERMRSQIQGYDMAVNNAQDGLSMLRTAEGALGDTNDLLHRMRELSVQGANDTLTLQDRVHIQEELDGIKEAINHVARYTNFNKKKLLDGTSGALWSASDEGLKVRVRGGLVSFNDMNEAENHEGNYKITVRAEPGKAQVQETSIMDAAEMKTAVTQVFDEDGDLEEETKQTVQRMKTLAEIGQFYTSEGAFIVEEPQNITLIQGDGKTAGVMLYSYDTLQDTSDKINDAIANGLGQAKYTDNADNFSTLSFGASRPVYDDDGNITGYDMTASIIVRSAVQGRDGEIYFAGNDDIVSALGLSETQRGYDGIFDVSISDAHTEEELITGMKITGNELRGIIHPNVDVEFSGMAGIAAHWDGENYVLNASGDYSATVHLTDNGIIFQVGTNQDENFAVNFGNVAAETLGVDRVNVMTHELAERSITYIDEAIDSVVKQRTQIVSYENSLEHNLANMASSGQNLEQSRSRITDADYAKSTMRYIEFQILSNAEHVMLAQANQQPEAVFSLMGD